MNDPTDLPTEASELQAYFDGELTPQNARRIEASLERDPAMRSQLSQMGAMQRLVSRSMEMRAAEVPRARFEQIWDEIDRTIAKEAATPAAAPSFWSRVSAAFKPLRMPVMVAAGAAAVALIGLRLGTGDPVNQGGGVASVPEVAPVQPEATPAPAPPKPVTPAIAEAFPAPKAAEAEIHGVEFGGKNGRISHTGVVTVLYVEDDTAQKSERSL